MELFNEKRIILAFLIFFLFLFILGCSKTCESGLYTKDGKCCTYVCNIACPDEYKEGACNCECKEATGADEQADTNVDSVFEDDEGVKPPELPSP